MFLKKTFIILLINSICTLNTLSMDVEEPNKQKSPEEIQKAVDDARIKLLNEHKELIQKVQEELSKSQTIHEQKEYSHEDMENNRNRMNEMTRASNKKWNESQTEIEKPFDHKINLRPNIEIHENNNKIALKKALDDLQKALRTEDSNHLNKLKNDMQKDKDLLLQPDNPFFNIRLQETIDKINDEIASKQPKSKGWWENIKEQITKMFTQRPRQSTTPIVSPSSFSPIITPLQG